jgi:hypothetical protein
VLEVIGNTMRGMIRAPSGYVLLGGDFSAVKSRVLAWIAGEDWKVQNYFEFDRTGDSALEPYCVKTDRARGKQAMRNEDA